MFYSSNKRKLDSWLQSTGIQNHKVIIQFILDSTLTNYNVEATFKLASWSFNLLRENLHFHCSTTPFLGSCITLKKKNKN